MLIRRKSKARLFVLPWKGVNSSFVSVRKVSIKYFTMLKCSFSFRISDSQIQKNKYSVTLYYVVGEEEVEINWRLNKGLPIFPAAPEPTPQVLLPVNEPSVPHSPPQPSTTCRGPQKKNRVLYNLSPTTDDRIQIAQPSLLDSCQLNRPPDDPEIANVTCRTSSLSGFDLTSSAGPSMKHTFIVPSTDIRYKGNPETVVKSIINHPSAAKNIPVPSISGMLATEIVEESWWKRGLYDTNFSYPQAVVPKKTVMAKFLCIHTCNEVFVKLEISVNKCNWDLICKSLETHYSHAEIIPSLQVSDFSVGSVFVVQSSNRQWHRAQFQNGNVILCVDSGEKLLPTLSTIAKPLHPNLIRIPPVALKCVLTNVANQPDYRKQPSKWCRYVRNHK